MFPFIAVAILLTLCYFSYKLYIKPKKICEHYVKILKGLGYKVFTFPFQPFSVPFFQQYINSFQTKGDSFYLSKNTLKSYDVIVTNLNHYPFLVFVNLKVARELMTIDKIQTLVKVEDSLKLMKYVVGNGLSFI